MEEFMNKKIKLIIGGVFLLFGIVLIIFSIINSSNKKEEKEEEVLFDNTAILAKLPKTNDINTLINIDANFYNKIPKIIDSKLSNSYYVYRDKKITVNDVDSKILVSNIITSIDYSSVKECPNGNEDCDFALDKETIKNKIKEYYGDIEVELNDNIEIENVVNCKNNETIYECKNASIDFKSSKYSNYLLYNYDYMNINEIVATEEKGNEICIYIHVYEIYSIARLEDTKSLDIDNLDTFKIGLYNYSNSNDKLTNKVLLGKDYYEDDAKKTFYDKVKDKYRNNFRVFKHTYKLTENDNYVWVSTEEFK
jgi:hypothetical protein